MSALPALASIPEFDDTDDGGSDADALTVFIAMLILRVAKRGPLIRAALLADIEAVAQALAEHPEPQ